MLRHKSVIPMRTAKIGYILMSALFFVLGVLLIIFPEISAKTMGIVISVSLIIFGIIKLIGYFSKDLYRLAFQHDLAFGILLITLGIIIIAKPEKTISFICILMGIVILADGLFKIQVAVDAKAFGIKLWWLIFSLAVITGSIGFVLIIRPSESSRLLLMILGISLIVESCLNLSTVLSAVKIIRHQMPDKIDIEIND